MTAKPKGSQHLFAKGGRMKICIISDVFPPSIGGIQTFSSGLAENLSKDARVEHVRVLTFGMETAKPPNKKVEIIRLSASPSLIGLIKLALELLKIRDFAVFHSAMLSRSSFCAAILCRFLEKKHFVTVHGLDALSGHLALRSRTVIKKTFELSEGIFFNSKAVMQEVAGRYGTPILKLCVAYPGISQKKAMRAGRSSIRRRFGIIKGDFVVLFVGRLVKRKGADDLLKAISKVPDQRVKLLLVGDGPERQRLETLSEQLSLGKRAIFAGSAPASGNGIYPFYAAADVFCMPSRYLREAGDIEGLGMVFLEAQTCGLPAIGTESGGIPETIEPGKSGFLVREGDTSAIADRISLLFRDEKLRARMGRRGIIFVKNKFDWKKCVSKHLQFYANQPQREKN